MSDLLGNVLASLLVEVLACFTAPPALPPTCPTEYVLAMPSDTWVCLDRAK